MNINNMLSLDNILNSIYVDSLVDVYLCLMIVSPFFQINISSIKAHFNDVVALLGSLINYFSVIVRGVSQNSKVKSFFILQVQY